MLPGLRFLDKPVGIKEVVFFYSEQIDSDETE